MAYSYTRQSTIADGNTITAAIFNNEYNALLNAFAYSSSDAGATGHRHDGTAAQGGNIYRIGDLDFLNKIEADSTNNRWGFYVEVSSSAVEQIRIQDGAVLPVTDSDVDLGTSSLYFKDAYIDSITTTGNVAVGGNITVTGDATISGNLTFGDAATDTVAFSADVASNLLPSADNTYDLGASGSEWKDLYIDGTANIDSLAADTAAIADLTSGRVVLAGTSGELEDSGNLTFDGSTLTVTGAVTASSTMQGTTITATTAFVPDASDGAALGTSSLEFSDLFLADGAVINLGADQDTTLTHVADTGILLNSTRQLQFGDSGTYIHQSADGVLDLVSDTEIEINATTVDMNGALDLSGNATVGGTLAVTGAVTGSSTIEGTTITATTAFVPDASDGATLGSASLEFSDLYLADGAVVYFGDDQDVSLTHVADTGVLLSSTDQLQFGDSGTYIHQSADGVLDLVSDTEIELNATTIDINGAVDISGNLDVGGNLVVTGTTTFNGGTLTMGDAATDNVVFGADVNSNIIPNTDNTYDLGSSSQEWKDIYIDGTAYLDAINFNGTAITATAAELNILDGVTSTAAELNLLDGSTANTVVNSKAVIYGSSGELAGTLSTAAQTNVTSLGTLTTLTVDDITINGSTISDGGDLTLDIAGELIIDTDTQGSGNGILLKDDGTHYGSIFRSSSNLHIKSEASDQDMIFMGSDGGSEITALTLDMSDAGTAIFNHDITLPDNGKAIFGAGSDLQLYHDGSNSWVSDQGTGQLILESGGAGVYIQKGATETMGTFVADGAVSLYYDNAKKFETTSSGITVTGDIANSSGDMTIDVAGDIILDADSGAFRFKDAGTTLATFTSDSQNMVLYTAVQDKDLLFKGNDGGSTITALTLDMSAAGFATFKSGAVFNEDSADSDFRVESNGNANMLFVDAGNNRVGVGTGSPRAALEIYDGDVSGAFVPGTLSTWRVMQVRNNIELATGTAAGIALGGDGGSDTETAGIVGISDNSTGGICQLAFLVATGNNSIEAGRFDSSGNLLVGRTSAGSTGDGHSIRGADSAIFSRDGGEAVILNRDTSDGTIAEFRKGGTTVVGSISVTSTATAYNTSSDKRLKDNIVDAPSASSNIDAIQIRSFDWKADGTHQKFGMIAQELQEVAPEAVSGDAGSDEMMSVDYSKLVPMLVKEIQDLRARVAELESN